MDGTNRVPLSTCFFHFGELIVPANTGDPWSDPSQKCLVGDFTGRGRVDAICFRTNYHGVWFGYQIDAYPLVVAHNGHCLQTMGLIGPAGAGMPYYLPHFHSPDDLSLACRTPLSFNATFRLWMGNSHRHEDKRCTGLHVYVTGHDVEPAEGNVLDWTLVLPKRHPHTRVSAESILLTRHDKTE